MKTKDIRYKQPKYISMVAPISAIIVASGAMQTAKINATPVPHYENNIVGANEFAKLNKAMAIIKVASDTFVSISKLPRQEMLRRFKLTGRYTNRKKR